MQKLVFLLYGLFIQINNILTQHNLNNIRDKEKIFGKLNILILNSKDVDNILKTIVLFDSCKKR